MNKFIIEKRLYKTVNETESHQDNFVSNQRLDLNGITGRNVGNGPRSLLDHIQLGMAQQWARTSSQDAVGLHIAASQIVADRAQSWSNDGDFNVFEKSHKARHDAAVHNFLNALVGTVSEIRKSPAGVSQNFLVVVVDQVGQGGEQLPHCWDARWRVLVATQVGQSPRHIAQESGLEKKKNKIRH